MGNQVCREVTLTGNGVRVTIPNVPILETDTIIFQEDHVDLTFGYSVRDLVFAQNNPETYSDIKFKVIVNPEYKFYEPIFHENKIKREEARRKRTWRSNVDFNNNLCVNVKEENDDDNDDYSYQNKFEEDDEDFNVVSLVEIFQNIMSFNEKENCPPQHAQTIVCKDLSVEETKDNANKDWNNILKIYNSKRYHDIQKRWGNSSISNPKKNLSVLFVKSQAISYANDGSDEEDEEPAAKRPRPQPCSFVLDKLIKEMEKKLVKVRTAYFQRRAQALAEMTRQHYLQAQAQGSYGRSYNLMRQHRQEIKIFTDRFSAKGSLLLGPLRDRIKTLKSLKDETENFHKFYSDATKDNDSAFYLNPYEVDDLLSIEAAISNYRNIYDAPKFS